MLPARESAARDSGRPVYVIELRPDKGVDPERALKALLKIALRTFGLRCVRISNGRLPNACAENVSDRDT